MARQNHLWSIHTLNKMSIEKLQARVAELEIAIGIAPGTPMTVFVVECTEHERGWGSRPDGYMAFPTKKLGEAWIVEATKDRQFGNAPDYYISYQPLGDKPASAAMVESVKASPHGFLYFNRMVELLGNHPTT